jgi:hypothetical protein
LKLLLEVLQLVNKILGSTNELFSVVVDAGTTIQG